MPSYTTLGRVSLFSLLTANTIRNLRKEEGDTLQDALSLAQWSIGTVFIFSPGTDAKIVGWGVANAWRLGAVIVRSPYAQAAYVPYVAGLAASEVIDPVSGVDNFLGFTTGGYLGNADASPMAEGNDYFNFSKNIKIIGSHYYSKGKESARQAERYAEIRLDELKRRTYI